MNPTPTGTTTGSCPICGRTFTSTPHQRPRRRYCSERCRKTAWRHRHPGRRTHPRDVPPAVPRPDHVPDTRAAQAEPHTRCPHCHRPIAVISLLIAPAAAQVTTPGSPHGH